MEESKNIKITQQSSHDVKQTTLIVRIRGSVIDAVASTPILRLP